MEMNMLPMDHSWVHAGLPLPASISWLPSGILSRFVKLTNGSTTNHAPADEQPSQKTWCPQLMLLSSPAPVVPQQAQQRAGALSTKRYKYIGSSRLEIEAQLLHTPPGCPATQHHAQSTAHPVHNSQ